VPQIEVTFDIDANGIVHVSAKDHGTGKEQKIRIESSSGLSKEEIDRMEREAKEHEEEDKVALEKVEARNSLDSLVYSTEKSMKEFGEKIGPKEKKAVEDALAKAKEALKSEDTAAIKKATEELNEAAHKLSETVYQEAQKKAQQQDGKQNPGDQQNPGGQQQGPQEGSKSSTNEKVVDAEYEVVDDEKKKK